MREQAALLGPRKSLLGIVTSPAQGSAAAGRPAVVILNAGIIHHVGPNRMFVPLARRLAESGYLAVRFDLSGIGDSEQRDDGLDPYQAAMADIREALDSIAVSRQVDKFILVGLCSGADHAIAYCGSDPRIVGVAQMDASIPRTKRYYLHHYRQRLFRLKSWANFTAGRHPFWLRVRRHLSLNSQASAGERRPDLQSPQIRAFLEAAYAGAVASGIELLSVFTADLESQHNYREQILEAFPSVPFGAQLQLEFFTRADHTFSGEADRNHLIDMISAWVAKIS